MLLYTVINDLPNFTQTTWLCEKKVVNYFAVWKKSWSTTSLCGKKGSQRLRLCNKKPSPFTSAVNVGAGCVNNEIGRPLRV